MGTIMTQIVFICGVWSVVKARRPSKTGGAWSLGPGWYEGEQGLLELGFVIFAGTPGGNALLDAKSGITLAGRKREHAKAHKGAYQG